MGLTAEEIYSIEAKDYQDNFWIVVDFLGKGYKCQGFSRWDDESEAEMREAGYIFVENSYQFGKELWIHSSDIQE